MKFRQRIMAFFLAVAVMATSLTMAPALSAAAAGETVTISDMKVNYLSQPLGVDQPQPSFSYLLSSAAYDKGQSAYRLIVSRTPEEAEAHNGTVWDSGRQESQNNYDIVYTGSQLDSRTRYYWTVQVWDEDGQEIGWSDVSYFETGIMSMEEWNGDWIGIKDTELKFDGSNWIWRRDGASFSGVPEGTQYFRKSFELDQSKTVSSVYIGLTADDEYELYINGEKAGLNGGTDSWKNGKLYDITNSLKPEGKNVIAVSAYNSSTGYAGFLSKMEITYTDGTKDTYVSDASWKMSKSEEPGWMAENFDDSKWIAPDQIEPYGNSPWGNGVTPSAENAFAATVLRKEFDVQKGAIKNARAYISGLGFFELKINGKLPDDTVLNPANTQYTQTALYRVFDVTKLLQEGKNAIGVELGNNFYNETCSVWGWQEAKWRDAPKLRMELVVEYENGETESILSDNTWKATKEGPITTNSIYYGETYDANKELTGYDNPGYDDASWGTVQMMDAPAGVLKAQMMEPIRRTYSAQPATIEQLENGSYVITAPQMLAGWIALNIKGAAKGDKITITYGEKRNEDGQVQKLGGGDGVNGGWWPKAYNQQDNYICKGEPVERFEPKFSYKGYEYVQIDGYKGALTAEDITCYRVSNDMEITGTFDSSNELFNKMHRMMMTTMNNNMQGKPTDTPVWEKNGWLGDANVALETMTYNYDFVNMLTRFVETMEDCQKDFGNVPNMVPTGGWGNDNSVVWNSVFVFGVDQMLDTYGNESYLLEQYEPMRKMALMDIEESRKHGWTWSDGQLGDWVSPMGQGDENQDLPYSEGPSEGSGIVGTAFAYHLLDVMAQLADRLQKTADAAEYRAAMANIYTAFNEKFYNKEKQIYETTTWNQAGNRERYRQTSQLVPLAYGLVPKEYKEDVLVNLVKDIKTKNYHLDTGCVGSKFILPVLTDNGYPEVAYKIATQTTYPSWGFMAERGTSLWEMWETTSRSLGHYFLGTYDEWFFKGVAGIKEMQDGYQTLTIEPALGNGVTYANTSVKTVRGQVGSNWKLEGGQATFDISVPVGTTADIILPNGDLQQIKQNGESISTNMPGIHAVEAADGKAKIVVGSGTYQFTAPVSLSTADKIDLKYTINKAKRLVQLDYEKTAWEALAVVRTEAEAVRDNKAATQVAIDEVTLQLDEKITDMDNYINQSRKALKETVAAAEKPNNVAYPLENVSAYEKAYKEAKAGCTDVDLTNEQIDALAKALTDAAAELEMSKYTNYALNGKITASSSHEDAYWGWGKALLTDGDRKNSNKDGEYTGYSSSTDAKGSDHGEWLYVNMGTVKEINAVSIYPATASPVIANSCYGFPKSFEIQVSDNGLDWTTVATITDYPVPSYGPINFMFKPVRAKYVKLDAKNLNPKVTDYNYYYMQLSEMEIYNSENDIAEITFSNYQAPKEKVSYGQDVVKDNQVEVVANKNQKLQGTWSAVDKDGNLLAIEGLFAGHYKAKLTFDAPLLYRFQESLAGTAADKAVITVEDNGQKLVYTYDITVDKAVPGAIADVSHSYIYAVGGVGEVKLPLLVEKYGAVLSYRVGSIADSSRILKAAPVINADGTLTYEVKNTGAAKQTALIPVVVTTKNYQDITIMVRVALTDKTPVTVKCQTKNTAYTGKAYAGLSTPTGVVTAGGSPYTGGFIITYNTKDGKAPVAPGTYTVTITTKDLRYAGVFKQTFQITQAATSVSVSSKLTLKKGQTKTLTAKVGPANATDRAVTWKSSNAKIVSVNAITGKIKAVRSGKATITVSTRNGKKANCTVTVTEDVRAVKLNATKKTLGLKESYTLKASLVPSNGLNKKLRWKSSNTKVASVSSTGKVTAKKAGKAVITVATDNGKKATCTITVKKAPTSVKLSAKTKSIKKGKTSTIKAVLSSGSAGKVTYSSSNKKVATIDSNGKIKAIKKGKVKITVKTYNGKKAYCTVTVK